MYHSHRPLGHKSGSDCKLYCADFGSKLCQNHKMAAPECGIFWLHILAVGRSRDTSSIFLYHTVFAHSSSWNSNDMYCTVLIHVNHKNVFCDAEEIFLWCNCDETFKLYKLFVFQLEISFAPIVHKRWVNRLSLGNTTTSLGLEKGLNWWFLTLLLEMLLRAEILRYRQNKHTVYAMKLEDLRNQ